MFETGAKLKAEKGAENVYDFSLGNPMLEPPESFYQVLGQTAAQRGPGTHGYMPNAGYPGVRQKVADYLNQKDNLGFAPDDILMTVGAAGAANVVFKALVNPGEEVVVPTPYFVEYDFYADNHGASIKRVATKDDFSLNLDAMAEAITEKTAAVMINTPNNPTGQVYSKEELAKLADILSEAGQRLGRPIYLISDEPYKKIIFDGYNVPSIFQSYANSIVLTSFSKDLSLAGERIGYIALNPKIEDKPQMIAAMNLANRILGFVNAPALMQKVVAELLQDSADMNEYARKRDLFCDVLDQAGYEYVKPKGAFYIFPKSPIADDVAFVKAAVEECLLLVPGSGFMGPGHFRIAFCCEDAVIERSVNAFKKVRERF
jgi:aspartate aminotransferase